MSALPVAQPVRGNGAYESSSVYSSKLEQIEMLESANAAPEPPTTEEKGVLGGWDFGLIGGIGSGLAVVGGGLVTVGGGLGSVVTGSAFASDANLVDLSPYTIASPEKMAELVGPEVGDNLYQYAASNDVVMLEKLAREWAGHPVLNVPDTKTQETPIYIASYHGHDKCVAILIRAGANVTVKDKTKDQTSLFVAALRGKKDVVPLLIRAGPETINMTNRKGWTPVYACCTGKDENHPACLRFLVKEGADVNLPDAAGKTPLEVAVDTNTKASLECLDILVGAGARENIKSAFARLCDAAKENKIEVLNKICEDWSTQKPSIFEMKTPGVDASTPLYLAAKNNNEMCVLRLLDMGAVKDTVSGANNETAAFVACSSGSKQALEVLINYKANLLLTNKAGCTPAFIAAQAGKYECLDVLIKSATTTTSSTTTAKGGAAAAASKPPPKAATSPIFTTANKAGVTPIRAAKTAALNAKDNKSLKENCDKCVKLLTDAGAIDSPASCGCVIA